MRSLYFLSTVLLMSALSCKQPETAQDSKPVKLITLDPGHFHAALVQKSMYPQVDSNVYVYAPKDGEDLQAHLNLIKSYNNNSTNPTHWNEIVYTGNDFLDKMLQEKKGNVVVLAGNNGVKVDYILKSIQGGFNVFADKPMVIDTAGFVKLKEAFDAAKKNNLELYDIMTERYEITTMLQRALSMDTALFGELQKGTEADPAVTKESVHHYYKYVSGAVLTRPAWFLDVAQQGEGIVDVTTHLVDLVQWECFPDEALDYTKDIQLQSARHWATDISHDEFSELTKLKEVPEFLQKYSDGKGGVNVMCNGEINYTVKGVHAKVSVEWKYKAPNAVGGTGDTHYSIMRGTKANLIIRQMAEQQFKPTLYIEPIAKGTAYEKQVEEAIQKIDAQYPGVTLKKNDKGWEVIIPEKYKEGHESHFARVMNKYLDYLQHHNMPAWEVPNMLAKYYTTTEALKMAEKAKK